MKIKMKKYKVSNGMTKIINAKSPKDAEEIFLDSFNECICDMVSVIEIKKKKRKVGVLRR